MLISIHALLAESDREQFKYVVQCRISIHALLAESDWLELFLYYQDNDFYPRSPCGERLALASFRVRITNFYPRSPCGERPRQGTSIKPIFCISIHALLAESDRSLRQLQSALRHFYPRSPCGERRAWMGGLNYNGYFYPRSPCGERHHILDDISGATRHFYPRSPCGERLAAVCEAVPAELYFYPRSPCGERRVHYDNYNLHCVISIHALLAESDCVFFLRDVSLN